MQVALQGLNVVASTVTVTSRPTDTEEVATVSTFMSTGCGCHKLKGSPCSRQFSLSYVEEFRASCAELIPAELDMVIMGQLVAGMNTSDIVSTLARHKEDDREKCYTTFTHQGKPVCLKMFRFLHGIGEKRLKNLTKNVKSNGLCPRVHRNTNDPDTLCLSLPQSTLCASCLVMPSSTHCFFLAGFRDTAAMTSSSYHRACQSEQFGRCIMQQLKSRLPFIQ